MGLAEPSPSPARSRVRWTICALLFFATTINYLDRSVLGVLAPTLRSTIGWTDQQYGWISGCFTLAYAIGYVFAGRLMDRFGIRIGYAVALLAWSLAAVGHAFAASALGFMVARFALGLGEAGNFPAALKAIAEWFPKKERAYATGLFNAGSNIGAILAPALVPWITLTWGWPTAFVLTGVMGLIWLAFWWPLYRPPAEHTRVSSTELALIHSDPPDPPQNVSWSELLGFRQTWAFVLAKLSTDAVWWFFLFWFSPFMADSFGVDLKSVGLPMITVYLLADIGSVLGGWLSSALIGRGVSVNVARKSVMLLCALCVLPVALAPHVSNLWTAVLLVGLATSAHQGFSANLFTVTSDLFPRKAVASVAGIGGSMGALGGFFLNVATGWIKQQTGSYSILFLMAGGMYLLALFLLHALAPRLTPVQLRARSESAVPEAVQRVTPPGVAL
jgi:MFS transporter, ACS family, hexuronate transporter